MIPKTIHYCWFGGNPLPRSAKKCINSWQKQCPDYQIIEWNERNFDVNCNAYCSAMYAQKKWAFLSDYARLKIIYEYGGVYLDTDVELIRSLDRVINNNAFMGLETTETVATGLGFGAEKGCSFVKENMLEYENFADLSNPIPCPEITTKLLDKYGLDRQSNQIQRLAGITIYPVEYFCPKHTHTGIVTITPKTISIHHFDGSWNTDEERSKTLARWKKYRFEEVKLAPKVLLRRIIGDKSVESIKGFLRRNDYK